VLFMIFAMLLSLGLAAGIALYVAFAEPAEEPSGASWLGDVTHEAVEARDEERV